MVVYYIWNVLTLGVFYAVKVAVRKAIVEAGQEQQRAAVVAYARHAFPTEAQAAQS